MTLHQEADVVVSPATDAIRIVPLHVSGDLLAPTVGPAAAPHLTYRNGPLLTNVKVFTVYWGAEWESSPLDATATDLDNFFGTILTSPLIDQLAEYGVAGRPIGHGSWIGRAVVTTPAHKHVVADTRIQHMLSREISGNAAFPTPDDNTLFFVYLPPGVAVVQGGSRSCQAFCGYHNNFTGADGSNLYYAAMPYPGCQGCTAGLTDFDALTSTSSHELCEAITDPVPGQGWYDDVNGEIGDICAWKSRKLGAYTVQLEWSNGAGSCL
ncbi:hypothetical protein SAMN04515671_0022 [Nakamurella panacisegetis]|uniref:Uncharacterized protein n=1 Tax=Nakamurella panacisegetis TaxID=1090615 RepID=A0A1H0HCY1_9ACTN|nr:hypothetical protein [Nakamurella panacisegetis]SDO17012.1 hypothetical protein SAMN04515671_0022 [Nakamurella panacisegetis]